MNLDRLKKLFFSKKADDKSLDAPKTEEVCVFPLPNVVLIPGNVLPLHIFEERYKQMTEEILKANLSLAMSLVKTGAKGESARSLICGAGSVQVMEEFPDGRKNIFVEGFKRLRIVKYLQENPYIKALAEAVPDIPFSSEEDEKDSLRHLSTLSKRWIFLSRDLPDDYISYVDLFTKPHMLADFIGFHFLPSSDEKQSLLEMVERRKRVERMVQFIEDNIRRLEEIGSKAMEDVSTTGKIIH